MVEPEIPPATTPTPKPIQEPTGPPTKVPTANPDAPPPKAPAISAATVYNHFGILILFQNAFASALFSSTKLISDQNSEL